MHSLPHPPFLLWGMFEDHLSDICIILDLAILIKLNRKQYLFLEGMVSTPYNSIFSELKISHFFSPFCLLSLYRRGTAFHGVVLITLWYAPWHLVTLVSSPDGPQRTLIYEPIIGFPINICQNNILVQTKAVFIYSYKRALNFQQRIAYHQKHSINESNLWRHGSRGWLLKGYSLF